MRYRICVYLWLLHLALSPIETSAGTVIAVSLMDPLGISKDDAHQTPPEPPSPRNLDPQWWDYFAVPLDQLNSRIESVVGGLDKLSQELEGSQAEAAKPLIARISTNLKSYSDILHQKKPEIPLPSPIKEQYTIDEYLNILHRMYGLEGEIEDERSEERQLSRTLTSARTAQDALVLAYRDLTDRSPEKLQKGLELMANRASLAYIEQKFHSAQDKETAMRAQQLHMQQELKAAPANLIGSPAELEDLFLKINAAQKELLAAQDYLTDQETQSLKTFPDTRVGMGRAQLATQLVLLARAEYAWAELHLLFLQIRQALTTVLINDKPENVSELMDRLGDWKDAIKRESTQIKTWREASTVEYERAYEGYLELSLPGREKDLKQLGVIYQERANTAQQTLVALQRLKNKITEANLLRNILEDRSFQYDSHFQRWLFKATDTVVDSVESLGRGMDATLFRIGDIPVTPWGLLRALAILAATYYLSQLVHHGLRQMGEGQHRIAPATFYTLGRLAHYTILMVGLLVALASIGLTFTNFLIVAGALSVGIGFGLQSIMNNFFSGLIILFEQNFKVGDYVELDPSSRGEITHINVRSTIMRLGDGQEVVIPNSDMIQNKVINWTRENAFRRLHVPFEVSYGADKELVRKAILEAADRVYHTLKNMPRFREPEVCLCGFGDSALRFELVVWVNAQGAKRPSSATSTYLWEIHNSLVQYNIDIPFPQRDIHIKSVPKESWQN